MKKILVHICCGPCAISVIDSLRAEKFEVIGYFYNPNIWPEEEFLRRLKAVKKTAEIFKVKLIIGEYDTKVYTKKVNYLEKPKRCFICYGIRLGKTASKAHKLGIRFFTSTLLVSPYQNLEKISEISGELAKKNNLRFVRRDFIKNFHNGHRRAREIGLYCQKYCGCESSYRERKRRERYLASNYVKKV